MNRQLRQLVWIAQVTEGTLDASLSYHPDRRSWSASVTVAGDQRRPPTTLDREGPTIREAVNNLKRALLRENVYTSDVRQESPHD